MNQLINSNILYSLNLQAEHPDMDSRLPKALRKELRHAVDSIKMENKQVCDI